MRLLDRIFGKPKGEPLDSDPSEGIDLTCHQRNIRELKKVLTKSKPVADDWITGSVRGTIYPKKRPSK